MAFVQGMRHMFEEALSVKVPMKIQNLYTEFGIHGLFSKKRNLERKRSKIDLCSQKWTPKWRAKAVRETQHKNSHHLPRGRETAGLTMGTPCQPRPPPPAAQEHRLLPSPGGGAGGGTTASVPPTTACPREAAGTVCSCKSLTAPSQQSSDIAKAHQLSRCSDPQAIAKTVPGRGKSRPVVLKSLGRRDKAECAGSRAGGGFGGAGSSRLAELIPQESQQVPRPGSGGRGQVRAPTEESALTLQTRGLSPALPFTCCVTQDRWFTLSELQFPPIPFSMNLIALCGLSLRKCF